MWNSAKLSPYLVWIESSSIESVPLTSFTLEMNQPQSRCETFLIISCTLRQLPADLRKLPETWTFHNFETQLQTSEARTLPARYLDVRSLNGLNGKCVIAAAGVNICTALLIKRYQFGCRLVISWLSEVGQTSTEPSSNGHESSSGAFASLTGAPAKRWQRFFRILFFFFWGYGKPLSAASQQKLNHSISTFVLIRDTRGF